MKKRKKKSTLKIRPLLITILALSGVVYFAISRLPKGVPLSINEVAVAPATVILSLPATVSASSDTAIPITMSTGGAQVSAAQIELIYDPVAISVSSVTMGNTLTVELVKPTISQGKITFTYAAKPDSGGYEGTGTLATLTLRALGTSSTLAFTQDSMVAAVGSNSNMLKSVDNATIQIAGNPTSPTTTTLPPAQSNQSPVITQSDRVFDETGNFDYSKQPSVFPLNTLNPPLETSVFVRFLTWVKSIFYTPTPQPISINVVIPTGTTTLDASPPPTHKTLGQSFVLDINARSGTDKVTAIQLELTYDPAKLELSNFVKTNYLPNFLAEPTIASGKLTATLAVPPDSGGKANWGTVGKITVKPLALGSQTITFGPNTLVSATSASGNVLKIANPIVIGVNNLGDINKDKKVDLFDYNLFVADYGKTGYSSADLDQSSKVDLFDYNLFVANYGQTSP